MQGILHLSESWLDPVPCLKRSIGIILAVLLVEGFFIWMNGLDTGLSPVYLLAAARLIDLAIITLLGPATFRRLPPPGEMRKAFALAAVPVVAGMVFLIAWQGVTGKPFLKLAQGPFSLSPLKGILFFLNACLLSPVVEELFFRGILYRGIRERQGIWVSTIGVSLVFALLHLHFNSRGLVPFLGSIIFCLGYEKNKSILTPVVLHVLGNVILFGSGSLPFL
jgi:membrane protease YdiL (CAAX protease family)